MFKDSAVLIFAVICMVGGAFHVLAPDHWMPASLLSWQRGWPTRRLAFFSLMVFVPHLFLGFLIYWALSKIFLTFDSSTLLVFSFVLVGAVAVVRSIRFKRIYEVLRMGPQGSAGLFTVVSLLGPCESLIPILIKAKSLGAGYMLPSVFFFLGTVISGVFLMVSGQYLWNCPHWFPRGLRWSGQWSKRSIFAMPAVVGVLFSLMWMFRLC